MSVDNQNLVQNNSSESSNPNSENIENPFQRQIRRLNAEMLSLRRK